MKATIRDSDTLRSLKPLEFSAYLRNRGWQLVEQWQDKASIWTFSSQSGETHEVIVPLKSDLADFAFRTSEALGILENVEKRSQIEIVRDLLTTSADLIRLRAIGESTLDGAISLEEGVAFNQAARDLLLAAACAAVDKRPYFPRRKPAEAIEYLKRSKLGQTEQGSYVVTILSPVTPELKSLDMSLFPVEPEEPFERTVTTTLASALNAISTAIPIAASSGDWEPIKETIAQGVNANLCDAIVALTTAAPAEGLDVSISWSRNRHAPLTFAPRYRFLGDTIPLIEEASRKFKAAAPLEDFVLNGLVVGLHRDDGAPVGQATVFGFVEDQPRKVALELSEADYNLAIQAHRDRLPIQCVGDLVKEGRSYRLKNPRRFHLAPSD